MPGWLVTGGSGFLGGHLLNALEPTGVEVTAVGRRPLKGRVGVRFQQADLDQPETIRAVLETVLPSVVIHTAGRTPPADAADLYRSNTLATIHLLDALRAWGRPVRVVLAGSAAELGPVGPVNLPVGEDHSPHPADAYGRSKLLATTAGLAASPPLEVLVARIFNPIGPGLPPSQAFGRFAARLCERTPDPLTITVGDLDARRDFIDVRDVAQAFIALAERGRAGLIYHVGTSRSHRVGEGLDQLIRLSGRDTRVAVDPALAGRGGPSDSRADIRRIIAQTGWRPEISWEQSLADLWDEARARDQAP